ncbi:hypothetical protein PMZ80_008354 [Knufia obscura]|uniref:Uncharacterized protein n=2 Tax=Knufia TaxID=430999 RepID=A0AAN8EB96_9EURO|nr:hypothetical protein PMZ80_008354 [Knufia obscura]KAK5951239.1 hypothetical protein OHC33_007657 [Knufia fluminis]
MSPIPLLFRRLQDAPGDQSQKPSDPNGLVLEAWAEGYMIGSLIIMTCITLANMRRGVLLHKLILIELIFGYWQGFFILFNPPIYAWWLSAAAIPLNISWWLHNVIAWMKLRPFLNQTVSRIFIGTVILVIPYWITEIYANFAYFHNINDLFLRTRPWEALCRDPWWIAAAVFLIYNIKTKYDLSLTQIVRISPRFAVMLAAMALSIIFIVLDVLSVTEAFRSALPVGINPFWKLSFVFKCLTDSVVLDDFKTALDRLRAFKISRLGSFALDDADRRNRDHQDAVYESNRWAEPPPGAPLGRLPDMPMNISPTSKGWPKEDASSSHVEERPDVVRTASRDRDMDENGIRVIDHAHKGSIASITESDQERLNGDGTWTQRSSASDADLEYAEACRQMASNDKKTSEDRIHSSR